ncbi:MULTISPECIES: MEDS domain-containing protein [unclassified Streptomyces]|uniref:MEDS domain-containing protein n=1 Tax=Streptomyces sp. NPDC007872 TaxID=3364782 RepID=UPI00369EC7A9
MRDASATAGARTAADGHSSVVFSSDAEWAERLVAFVRAGLRRDEQVQYFADVTAPDLVMRTLTRHGVDAVSAVRRGQLTVTTAAETYLAGPCFDPDAMVGLWHEAVASAVTDGYAGLRAIGEMSWGARDVAGAERLLEYELRIHHEVFARLPLTAWCFYDRRLMPPDVLDVLLGAHLTRMGATGTSPRTPGLLVAPLPDRPGLRLVGTAGYENRHVTAGVAGAVAGSPAPRVDLDLTRLDHLDVAALADIARAAARRPAGTPVRLLGAPPSLTRLLEIFPELGHSLEVTGR